MTREEGRGRGGREGGGEEGGREGRRRIEWEVCVWSFAASWCGLAGMESCYCCCFRNQDTFFFLQGSGHADTDNCSCPPCCYNITVDMDTNTSTSLINKLKVRTAEPPNKGISHFVLRVVKTSDKGHPIKGTLRTNSQMLTVLVWYYIINLKERITSLYKTKWLVCILL